MADSGLAGAFLSGIWSFIWNWVIGIPKALLLYFGKNPQYGIPATVIIMSFIPPLSLIAGELAGAYALAYLIGTIVVKLHLLLIAVLTAIIYADIYLNLRSDKLLRMRLAKMKPPKIEISLMGIIKTPLSALWYFLKAGTYVTWSFIINSYREPRGYTAAFVLVVVGFLEIIFSLIGAKFLAGIFKTPISWWFKIIIGVTILLIFTVFHGAVDSIIARSKNFAKNILSRIPFLGTLTNKLFGGEIIQLKNAAEEVLTEFGKEIGREDEIMDKIKRIKQGIGRDQAKNELIRFLRRQNPKKVYELEGNMVNFFLDEHMSVANKVIEEGIKQYARRGVAIPEEAVMKRRLQMHEQKVAEISESLSKEAGVLQLYLQFIEKLHEEKDE